MTYSPGALPVLGALGITIVPGVSPTISAPDGGAVHTGDTIVFSTTGSAATVKSTTPNWSFSLPVSGAKPASVTVPVEPGTYGYGVGNAKNAFQATSTSSGGSTQPPPTSSGGGPVLGLTGGQKQPPAAGSAEGGAPANGSGAAGSGPGGSGAVGSTGSGGGFGSVDSSQFGSGSGDFPNLPGGVFAPVAPQAGSAGGGPAPEIAAGGGSDGGFAQPSPAPSGDRSTNKAITTASHDVGTSSSVSGPAAVAAALLALVVIGLTRAWVTHRPLRRQ